MRPYLISFACLCSALAFVTALPVPASNQELDVLQIPLSNGKELDVLTLGSRDQEQLIAERNKRTIGLLRELFPDITKQIDGIVNRIIAQVIRVAGPDVLRSVLGSNRNMTPRPNLAADFDDDDDDDDANKLDNDSSSATSSNNDNTRVKIDLPTFPPETSEADATNKVSSTSSSLGTSSTATSTTIPTTTTSTTSSTTPSTTTTSSSTSTTTTTTTSPISIIPQTTSPPATTTTTTTTTTESPIFIVNPTTTTPNPPTTAPTASNKPDFTLNVPNSLTSSMVNSLTTSLQNELNSNPNTEKGARDVNESQLMAIVESLNRLLNSTNYFVATRDNLSTSALSTQPTTLTITADSTTTPKITKLLPVNN